MRQVSFDDYLKDPIGKWVAGDDWLHFCTAEPWLTGIIFWGRVDDAAMIPALQCATATRLALPDPHPALVDGKRATFFDPATFTTVAQYVHQNLEALRPRVLRLAGVRTAGMVGALAEGFFRVVPAPYAVDVFSERIEALRWLERPEHAPALDEIENTAGARTAGSRILGDLHRVIEKALAQPDLAVAAKELGLSVRSLQRRLHTEDTTFQREVSIVRVRVAQRLMLESDASLADVAAEAGFASAATFSVIFRKIAGVTPKEWRDARS